MISIKDLETNIKVHSKFFHKLEKTEQEEANYKFLKKTERFIRNLSRLTFITCCHVEFAIFYEKN
ncbi:hypothetical protein BpHYR1_038478 [Brachionus plicatilis]|uniref:Uncharacterized protein n=1 Tax=Brachionus plicatilis TaxID=10195 RepID=A0A3M7P602_BRAPC|nr:hypothetical protein BpHYR1_038478 [Brachionus plicatilis]